jgi:hypothetical protein
MMRAIAQALTLGLLVYLVDVVAHVQLSQPHHAERAHVRFGVMALPQGRPQLPPTDPAAPEPGVQVVDIATGIASPIVMAGALRLGASEAIAMVDDQAIDGPLPPEALFTVLDLEPGHYHDLTVHDASANTDRRVLLVLH